MPVRPSGRTGAQGAAPDQLRRHCYESQRPFRPAPGPKPKWLQIHTIIHATQRYTSTCYTETGLQRQAYRDLPNCAQSCAPSCAPICANTYDRYLSQKMGHTWGTIMQLCVRSFWPIFFATAGGEEQFWTNPRPTLGKGRCETHCI